MKPFGLPFALLWFLRFLKNNLFNNSIDYIPNPYGTSIPPDSSLHDHFHKDKIPKKIDAIVIGSGIGGLVLSAILAKSGKSVLVLEKHVTAGGCLAPYAFEGHEVDVGFHYVGMMSPEASCKTDNFCYPLFDWLCNGKLKWRKLDATDVVHFSQRKQRVSIETGDNWKNFKEMLKTMYPSECNGIDRIFELFVQGELAFRSVIGAKSLPPKLRDKASRSAFPCDPSFIKLWDKTGKRVLTEHLKDPVLSTLISLYYLGFSLPLDQLPFPALAIMMRTLNYGLFYPAGGTGSICKHLIDTIRSSGGRVLTKADVKNIIIHGKSARGVIVETNSEKHVIKAPIIVSDAGLRETFTKLAPELEKNNPEIKSLLDTVPPSLSPMMINVILDAPGEELGFHQGEEWIMLDVDCDSQNIAFEKGLSDLPGFVLVVFPGQRNIEKYGGMKTSLMTLMCYLPFNFVQQWQKSYEEPGKGSPEYQQFKKDLSQRVLNSLLEIEKWSHLRKHIKKVNAATPLTIEYYLNKIKGPTCGLAHTKERFMNPLTGPYTPISGLYLTGSDAACSGVSGATYGGYVTSVAILAKNPSKELQARLKAAYKHNADTTNIAHKQHYSKTPTPRRA